MTVEKLARSIAKTIRDMEPPLDVEDEHDYLANAIMKSAAVIAATVELNLVEIREELRRFHRGEYDR